jgi:hypothetical protein
MRQEIRDRLNNDELSRRRLLTTGAIDATRDLAGRASSFHFRSLSAAAIGPLSLSFFLPLFFSLLLIANTCHVNALFFFYFYLSAGLGAHLGCWWCYQERHRC